MGIREPNTLAIICFLGCHLSIKLDWNIRAIETETRYICTRCKVPSSNLAAAPNARYNQVGTAILSLAFASILLGQLVYLGIVFKAQLSEDVLLSTDLSYCCSYSLIRLARTEDINKNSQGLSFVHVSKLPHSKGKQQTARWDPFQNYSSFLCRT